MTRNNNQTETAEAEPEKTEWKTRSMIDADFRLPKLLRSKLEIKPHVTYLIKIVKQGKDSFTLSFQKAE